MGVEIYATNLANQLLWNLQIYEHFSERLLLAYETELCI
jgi:hypothetical protein